MPKKFKKQATHARIEGTERGFGGGYRVRIYAGSKMIATEHFAVPKSHRTYKKVIQGIELAYAKAKQYCASFGVE